MSKLRLDQFTPQSRNMTSLLILATWLQENIHLCWNADNQAISPFTFVTCSMYPTVQKFSDFDFSVPLGTSCFSSHRAPVFTADALTNAVCHSYIERKNRLALHSHPFYQCLILPSQSHLSTPICSGRVCVHAKRLKSCSINCSALQNAPCAADHFWQLASLALQLQYLRRADTHTLHQGFRRRALLSSPYSLCISVCFIFYFLFAIPFLSHIFIPSGH